MVPEILGSGGIGREEALSLPVERGRKEAEKRTALPGGQKGKGTRDQEDLPAPPAPLAASRTGSPHRDGRDCQGARR